MAMEKRIATNHGTFCFRPYEETDEEGVLRMWESAFGHSLHPDIWRWKYRDNPIGRQMVICITESGEPVTLYSGIPYIMNHEGREIRVTHLMDNMSHPLYRFPVSGRTGLYNLTIRHFISLYGWPGPSSAVFGFPGERHFRLGKLQFNYRQLNSGMIYLQGSVADLNYGNRSIWRKTEPVEQSGEVFNSLQEKLRGYYPLAVIRDEKFIRWRYFSHPVFHYKVYIGKSIWGGIRSYVVFRFDQEMATIVDIFTPDSAAELNALLAGAEEDLRRAGCSRIQTWLPSDHFSVLHMKETGFRVFPEPLGIIPTTVIYNPELHYEYVNQRLFYTMGDGDLF